MMSVPPTPDSEIECTSCVQPRISWLGWYRPALVVALFFVFSLQKLVQVRPVLRLPHLFELENSGPTKQWIGICVSFFLLALLMEFATARVAKWGVCLLQSFGTGRNSAFSPCSPACHRGAYFILAGLFLFVGLQGRFITGYIAATPSPGTAVALAWLVAWSGFALISLRHRPRWRVDLCGFLGLILVSRVYAYSYLPMPKISGDMLATINRSLDLLIQGKFPYIDVPPPAMPYWPITFLQYAPCKLLGWDFRVVNLIVELATVVVTFHFFSKDSLRHADAVSARLALPTAMLFPSWTFYSAETQFPVSVLLAVLFCRSVACFQGRSQALTLGVAVAANQTFGAFGLSLFPFWGRWFGPLKALRLTAIALVVCLLIISPFLSWNAPEFFRVSLLSLKPFTPDQIAGTFSLRPVLDGLLPWGAPFLLALTFAVVGTLGVTWRGSKTEASVVITLGYCVALLLLHRSFSHYFLPVIAMILVAPHSGCGPLNMRNDS